MPLLPPHVTAPTCPPSAAPDRRLEERVPATWPARLTWKDQRGTTRFASVVARNIGPRGMYVECRSAVTIPLFRLVQIQLEHDGGSAEALPVALGQGRTLAAVYRISPPTPGGKPQGLGLRLMVDPKRQTPEIAGARATA